MQIEKYLFQGVALTHAAPMRAHSASKEEAGLIRALGVPGLTANIVNSTIGAGIFALPALVAVGLGAAAPLAFVLCAIAMSLVVTSFAMAGSRVSLTGGLYAYVEVAFGRYVGFLAGVLYFLYAVLADSGIVNILATSVGILVPSVATATGRFSIILLVFAALAAINIRGVRAGARAVGVVTLIKLLPIVIFIVAGIFFIHPAALAWHSLPSGKMLGHTVLLLIFAFGGIEVALVPSGEVKVPWRTVPRAIFAALAITTLVYIMIQIVAQGVLGDDLAKHSDGPLAEAALQFLGNFGRVLMLAGATISVFGAMASSILGSPRILFAFGRDAILPKWFAHIHGRFHTPHVAIIVYAAIAFTVSLSSTFQQLAILSNVALLLLYLFCCCAALELLRRDVRGGGKPFNFPCAWVIPFLAVIVIVWILTHATMKEFAVTAGCLAVASILFFIRQLVVTRPEPAGA